MQTKLPKGWRMATLGELCDLNPSKPELSSDSLITFLPMSAISNEGQIVERLTKQYREVQKGYTGFIENDVLFAKITPCMENGKGAIARNLINAVGFGSTEFHVVRPKREILPDFVYRYLSLKPIRKFAESNMTGSAGQKRVPESFLKRLTIPLPPLPTQRSIADILEEADCLRKLRRQTDEKMQDLIPSLFVEMFGDPATNPKGWVVVSLGDICKKPEYGYTASAVNTCIGPKFLRITDIQEGNVDWSNVPFCECSDANRPKYLLKSGDIAVARIGATTGKAFLVKDCPEAVFASYLIRLRTNNNLLPEYLFTFMNTKSYWSQINSAKGSRLKHGINIPVLSNLKIPLPPLPLQQEFAARVEEIEAEKARQAESKKKLDELFNSLMQRAFTGELVA